MMAAKERRVRRKGLSEEAKRAVEQLRSPSRSIPGLGFLHDSATAPLAALGELAEPHALPTIARFLVARRQRVRSAAARAVAATLDAIPIKDLPWLDQMLRGRSEYSTWPASSTGWVVTRDRTDDPEGAGLRLHSMHPSGYVREAALRAMRAEAHGAELPFVLLRLNDWVPEVRAVATQLAIERSTVDHARSIVECLPLILRLPTLGRANHRIVVEALLAVLARQEAVPELLNATRSHDRDIRLAAFRMLAGAQGGDRASAFRGAIGDPDPVVRLWAVIAAGTQLPDAELEDLLAAAERDRYGRVRGAALGIRLQRFPDTPASVLHRHLFDRNASVRAHAQHQLRTRYGEDVASLYRSAITEGGWTLVPALLGLGEVGTDADVPALMPIVVGAPNGPRAAAIRSVGRLAKVPPVAELMQAMRHETGRVSRMARWALSRRAGVIPAALAIDLYNQARSRDVRCQALSLLASLALWDVLPTILEASASRDDRERELGRRFLEQWLVRSVGGQVRPDRTQWLRCRAAFEEHRRGMLAAHVPRIEFVLRVDEPR
jgi:HEAT repeat protein